MEITMTYTTQAFFHAQHKFIHKIFFKKGLMDMMIHPSESNW